jgi:hypothetical protein
MQRNNDEVLTKLMMKPDLCVPSGSANDAVDLPSRLGHDTGKGQSSG